MGDGWLTVRQAAEVMNVSVRTLRRWNAEGHFIADRAPGPRGLLRYRRDAIDAAMRGSSKTSA